MAISSHSGIFIFQIGRDVILFFIARQFCAFPLFAQVANSKNSPALTIRFLLQSQFLNCSIETHAEKAQSPRQPFLTALSSSSIHMPRRQSQPFPMRASGQTIAPDCFHPRSAGYSHLPARRRPVRQNRPVCNSDRQFRRPGILHLYSCARASFPLFLGYPPCRKGCTLPFPFHLPCRWHRCYMHRR